MGVGTWNYRDDGRPSGASIFVGGFILGGLIVGTLGCVYAPQVVFVTVIYFWVFNRIPFRYLPYP